MSLKRVDEITAEEVSSIASHTGGDFTVEDVVENVKRGIWKALRVYDGDVQTGAVIYNVFPNKIAFIFVIVGKLITTEDNWKELQTILKEDGAIKIEAAMRDSTLRLWSRIGFTKKYNVAEVYL
jgi:hypothetical protein